MGDVAAFAKWRHDDHRDASAVAEEVKRLNISGVVISAALVEGDENGGFRPQSAVGLHAFDNLFDEALKQVELRRVRMAVRPSARLDVGDRGQSSVFDRVVEGSRILEVGLA